MVLLVSVALASAVPLLDVSKTRGVFGGINLVFPLGKAEDRRRIGVGIDGGAQWLWHEGPYWSDGKEHLAPLASVGVHVLWSRPYATAMLLGEAGVLYPREVADGGFLPLYGAEAGFGLGLSSDGSAGPVLTGELLGPGPNVQFEVMRWDGWHAPHLLVGANVELNCCSYLM